MPLKASRNGNHQNDRSSPDTHVAFSSNTAVRNGHPGDRRERRAAHTRAWLFVFFIYVGLTLAMYWPVASHLRSAIPHDLGDPLLNLWILWWNSVSVPFTTHWWNGPAFWPLPNALALSENLVGISILTSPMLWAGASATTAYNVSFLVSWPLSALGAHALAYRLTSRHDASLVAGLVFGFSPYRLAQVPHLQVLVSWWTPFALLALHSAVNASTAKVRLAWLAGFAVLWCVQVLSNGYLLVYFSLLVGLWLAWFGTAAAHRRSAVEALAFWAAAVCAVLPIVLRYRAVHHEWGLRRSIGEIVTFGGDVLSFATAPDLLALWRFRPRIGAEQELYPGFVAVCVVVVGIVAAFRIEPMVRSRIRFVHRAFLSLAAVFGVAAMATYVFGPWSLEIGPLTVSGGRFRKSFTVAVVCLIIAGITHPRLKRPYRERSPLLFYALATVVAWLMCLGPVGKFDGTWILERPPYWWLLQMPGLDALRVPTRFALVGTLSLSVAAALCFARLVRRRHAWVTTVILLALIADAWPLPMPMRQLPDTFDLPPSTSGAAVLELPLGANLERDVAAMYRAMFHARPVVNGYSGYAPPPYRVLQTALQEGDGSVLEGLRVFSALCVAIDRTTAETQIWAAMLQQAGAMTLGGSGGREFFLLPRKPPEPRPGASMGLTSRVIRWDRRLDRRLADGDLRTAWTSRTPQQGDERFTLTLRRALLIDGIRFALADYIHDYPRRLTVETSMDGRAWIPAWEGHTAGLVYVAMLESPSAVAFTITFPARETRHIRFRQTGRSRDFHWSIAEIEILGHS